MVLFPSQKLLRVVQNFELLYRNLNVVSGYRIYLVKHHSIYYLSS